MYYHQPFCSMCCTDVGMLQKICCLLPELPFLACQLPLWPFCLPSLFLLSLFLISLFLFFSSIIRSFILFFKSLPLEVIKLEHSGLWANERFCWEDNRCHLASLPEANGDRKTTFLEIFQILKSRMSRRKCCLQKFQWNSRLKWLWKRALSLICQMDIREPCWNHCANWICGVTRNLYFKKFITKKEQTISIVRWRERETDTHTHARIYTKQKERILSTGQ